MSASLHFLEAPVARVFQSIKSVVFVTEERAGVLKSTSSTQTEQRPRRIYSGTAAVGGC